MWLASVHRHLSCLHKIALDRESNQILLSSVSGSVNNHLEVLTLARRKIPQVDLLVLLDKGLKLLVSYVEGE
jgi:hypothetical protein